MRGSKASGRTSPPNTFDASIALMRRIDEVDSEILRVVRSCEAAGQTIQVREIASALVETGHYETQVAVADRIDDLVTLGRLQRDRDGFVVLSHGPIVLGEVS